MGLTSGAGCVPGGVLGVVGTAGWAESNVEGQKGMLERAGGLPEALEAVWREPGEGGEPGGRGRKEGK